MEPLSVCPTKDNRPLPTRTSAAIIRHRVSGEARRAEPSVLCKKNRAPQASEDASQSIHDEGARGGQPGASQGTRVAVVDQFRDSGSPRAITKWPPVRGG